jgi:biopolymer transport protein ExbB/TolQ
MQGDAKRNQQVQADSAGNASWAAAIFLSPILWGGLLTVGFYQLIPFLPVQRELAERYFCNHPLEYATAALFFVGMATLGLKAIGAANQKAALGLNLLGNVSAADTTDAVQRAAAIEKVLAGLSPKQNRSILAMRIRDVCLYVRGRRSGTGLEEHLKYLAELAVEKLHNSYALVRTITWAVPIIGFLGTVIGITTAIANVATDQLGGPLDGVTSGLAIAFDTTALALTLSLVLVFSSYQVEHSEQSILADVEEFGIKRITPLFPVETEPASPLIAAEQQASKHLIEKTEALINWQTQVWEEGIESLRQRWTETLEKQQGSLDDALRQGLASTLEAHQHQLGDVRSEFIEAFQIVSKQLTDNHTAASRAQQEVHQEFQQQMSELWQHVRTDFAALREEQNTRMDELLTSVSQNVSGWQTQLKESTEAGTAQLKELRRQGEILLKVVAQEEQLARLQLRLNENLEAVQVADTFEETLHSLTAAVHLLSAKAKPKAA